MSHCQHTFATHFTDLCFTLNMNSFMCPVKKLVGEPLVTEIALVRLCMNILVFC